MNTKIRFFAITILLMVFAGAYAGKPGSGGGCSDVPVSLTFMPPATAPAAMWNDDPSNSYQNSVDGVTALIHYDRECSGSRDVTFQISRRSKRFVNVRFSSAIPGSIIEGGPLSFAGAGAFPSRNGFNIRNLVGHTVTTPGLSATYYTKASTTFDGPDGEQYKWGSLPDDSTCPVGATCAPNLHVVALPGNFNESAQTGWVKVTYTPRDLNLAWSLTNTDKWLVEAEYTSPTDPNVQRITALKDGVHFGQYSFPFKVLVTALAPLPQ